MQSIDKKALNADEVIAITGGFSSLQATFFFCNCMFEIYCGLQAAMPIYSGMRPSFHCSLPNFESNTCNKSCPSYIYPNQHGTTAAEFDLACGLRSWLNSLFKSSYWVGYLVGVIVSGYFFDRYGRKKVIIALCLGQGIFSFLLLFIENIHLLIACRLLIGFFVSGGAIGTHLITLEYMPSSQIAIASQFSQLCFPTGEIFAVFFGYLFKNDWRMLFFVLALPTPFFFIGSIFFYPESFRWLLAVGRITEAEDIARQLAIRNGYPQVAEDLYLINKAKLNSNGPVVYTWKNLFWPSNVLCLTLTLCLICYGCSSVYYGLTYGVQDLSGNIYMNSFLMAVAEFPAFFVYMSANAIGRKYTTALLLLISGVAVIMVPFLLQLAGGLLTIGISLIGKMASTGIFEILFFYQVELFPSAVRGIGIGVCFMFARIAVIISPVFQNLGSISVCIPYLVYAFPSLLAVIVTMIFLPETKGKNLPDTFEDVFYKSISSSDRVTTSHERLL